MRDIYGSLGNALGVFGQSLAQQSQYSAYQQQAAVQYQNSLAQQQFNCVYMASSCKPKNIFVPITQEEVDMAEAWHEVNKIAPGINTEQNEKDRLGYDYSEALNNMIINTYGDKR